MYFECVCVCVCCVCVCVCGIRVRYKGFYFVLNLYTVQLQPVQ